MTPPHRRRSVDSDSSTYLTRDQPQQQQDMEKDENENSSGEAQVLFPIPENHDPPPKDEKENSSGEAPVPFPIPEHHDPPPSYTPPATQPRQHTNNNQVPLSGYRLPLVDTPAGQPFPGIDRTRPAPFTDADGKSPVFLGSAILEGGRSVHPCKIAPHLQPSPCRVPFAGGELEHRGRYDLLPFMPDLMEFVVTSRGQVPPGRRPVKGGFERSGQELYHAVAVVNGVKVPGKTGAHLVRLPPPLPHFLIVHRDKILNT
jgi:hypothetical protein